MAPHGPDRSRPVLRAKCWTGEAPTGGYLLTASLASGVRAGRGFSVLGRSARW